MEHLLTSPMANIIIPILFLILPYLIYKKRTVNKHVNLPPGKLGWPIIGESIAFATLATTGYLERFVADRMARYSPKVFKTSVLGEKTAFICDAVGNKFIFSNEKILVRTWFPDSVLKILSPDLKIPREDEFMRRRGLISGFLKPYSIQKYIEPMDSTVRQHMDTEWAPNSNITVHPVVKRLAFSLACRLFMGIDHTLEQTDTLEKMFVDVTNGFITLPFDLPGTTFRKAVNAANSMRAELLNIIRTKKLSETKDSCNFLSHLFSTTDEEGKSLREPDIANLLMGILIASHETISSLLTNIVYYLADHPHVYNLVLNEQLEIKRLKGGEQLLTWEDTSRMKYCRNVINEVMRLAPPAGGAFREVIHDISYEGFTIPKGWKILCVCSSTHRNPEYFPNPEKFDPTRFESGLVPFSFTPFGGGPRMCPGYEYARQAALVFIHNLVINFTWEKLIADEKIILAPVSFPAKGLPIKLQKHT